MGCKRGQKKLTRKSSSRDGTKRKKKKQDADQRRGWKGLGLLGGGRDWLLLTVGRKGEEAGIGEGKSTGNLPTPNASLSFKEIRSLFV